MNVFAIVGICLSVANIITVTILSLYSMALSKRARTLIAQSMEEHKKEDEERKAAWNKETARFAKLKLSLAERDDRNDETKQ